MTIITFRNGVLAADTQVSAHGSRVDLLRKIKRVNQWLIGGAGDVGTIVPVELWIRDGAQFEKPIDFGKIEDGAAILVDPDGVAYHVGTASPYVLKSEAQFMAIGSGSDAALAAMLLGATATRAVDIAKRIDLYCGGDTIWLNIDGTEQLELTKEIYDFVN